jgi:exonuclease I
VSSRAGTPLIVDAHAVSYRKGGHLGIQPLKAALQAARFDSLANTGRTSTLDPTLLSGFVTSAVKQSLHHLRQLKDQRLAQIRPRLEDEDRRLRHWFER